MSGSLAQARDLLNSGDVLGAETALSRAAVPQDRLGELLALRAGLRMRKRDFAGALATLDALLPLRPFDHFLHYNRGLVLYELGRFAEAAAAQRSGLKFNFQFAKGWMKLGACHLLSENWAEALACYERAVALEPEDAELHIGMGTMLSLLDADEDAVASYRRALALNPAAPEAEIGLGFALLKCGRWVEGWERFERRWELRPFGAPWDYRPVKPWRGVADDLFARRVVLRAEQGFGDTLHFIRYAELVGRAGGAVIVNAPLSLHRLIAGMGLQVFQGECPWSGRLIDLPLMSLPRVFGTTLESVPPPADFRVKPRRIDGARVGVCWSGGARPEDPPAHADDKRRSIPVEQFRPIIDACGGQAISLLQYDLKPWGAADWLDTAEIVAGLELVVTVDTAIAHLAGSLGVETWVLLRAAGCWRWLGPNAGDRTPWYPTMRLYRQPVLGEWGPVIERVVADLSQRGKR